MIDEMTARLLRRREAETARLVEHAEACLRIDLAGCLDGWSAEYVLENREAVYAGLLGWHEKMRASARLAEENEARRSSQAEKSMEGDFATLVVREILSILHDYTSFHSTEVLVEELVARLEYLLDVSGRS